MKTGRFTLHRQLWLSGLRESLSFKLNSALALFEKAVRLFILYHFFRAILPDARELERVILYLFVATLVEAIVSMDLIEEMAQKIASGEASYWLVRPLAPSAPLFSYCLGRSSVTITSSAVLLGVSALVAGGRLDVASSFIGPVLSLILGYFLSFLLQHLMGLLIFHTLNGWGVKLLYRALFYLLSGVVFPLHLLPEGLARFIGWLPFRHVIATPVLAILGESSASGLLVQLAWVIVLACLIGLVFRCLKHRFVTVEG